MRHGYRPNPLGLKTVDDIHLNRESWKIFQNMAEFVKGFERLAQIRPSVSFFGPARTPPDRLYYTLAEETARPLSDAGFSVVSGGGPGLMEAAKKGAFAAQSPSIGLNISLPMEQASNQFQDIGMNFRHFILAQGDVRQVRLGLCVAVGRIR